MHGLPTPKVLESVLHLLKEPRSSNIRFKDNKGNPREINNVPDYGINACFEH